MTSENETLLDLFKRAQEDPASLTQEERDLVIRAMTEVSSAVIQAMTRIGETLAEAFAPIGKALVEIEQARQSLQARGSNQP